MKMHPMPFRPEMLAAVLREHNRKTQTRRVIVPQPQVLDDIVYKYRKGDGLWVKEALLRSPDGCVTYAHDDARIWRPEDAAPLAWPWKPSKLAAMYCPKWASRFKLGITDVRVQRLQEISEEDALAEGIVTFKNGPSWQLYGTPGSSPGADSAIVAFKHLWESNNAIRGYGWDSNPWVYAISFKRLETPHA